MKNIEKYETWNLFIVIINTKLYFIYITLTRDDLHNFSKTNWPDNFDRCVYSALRLSIPQRFFAIELRIFIKSWFDNKYLSSLIHLNF